MRSTDQQTTGSDYRLWTTLKVPVGQSMDEHCRVLMQHTGCTAYKLMPAKGIFALGVGHVRRKTIEPGDKADAPAKMIPSASSTSATSSGKSSSPSSAELTLDEVASASGPPAPPKPASISTPLPRRRGPQRPPVIGRFSTFLEHVKPSATGQRVRRFNALFHWAVPPGREVEAGGEVGRHVILTHCYWREGGPEFNHVNIMAVCHGTEKDRVFAHKAAIDAHLAAIGLPVDYTNVFWGGRSEIKPSEISPRVHREWIAKMAEAQAAAAPG